MPLKNIMYVEDDLDNHTLIKLFLRNEPWDVVTTESPDQALDALEQNTMDLIIVDLNLQGEGDGAELIRTIRQNPGYQETPIFVFSGFDEHHFKQYGIEELVQRFFRKPTSKKVLVEAISEFDDTKESQM